VTLGINDIVPELILKTLHKCNYRQSLRLLQEQLRLPLKAKKKKLFFDLEKVVSKPGKGAKALSLNP
jgi:hypothetical protein